MPFWIGWASEAHPRFEVDQPQMREASLGYGEKLEWPEQAARVELGH